MIEDIESDKKAIVLAKKHSRASIRGVLAKKHSRASIRGTVGLGLAIVAMFAILLWQNSNLSTTLGRRSPLIEYSICYNERDAAERQAYNHLINLYISDNPRDPQVVMKLRNEYNHANQRLRSASDLNSKDRCPGLDVISRG